MTPWLGPGSLGRYVTVGASGYTLDFLIFWWLVSIGIIPLVATLISALAGMVNNYVWNAWTNFRKPFSAERAGRFLTVGALGLGVSASGLEGLIRLGVGPVWAKVLSMPVVVTGQFIANKYWTFR